ncbi:hypothetical protein EU799_05665 [Corynebacterium silvaticum]|uniref:hypothetical protein n=1 Tax=Corynebacterium silvaticum TaxID=2320431 RepID=UPI00106778CD|nr:hypothetical protein [Corynebacterium silvaticum]NOM65204.1 hypothetical protein [Corynebacterium silvaticum]TFA92783.1 hypothetical protein EU802_05485 [Corynebacterium silvaticum]TFA96467.1 hypothetical protein EU799_05665 [Corynebacterium silvaticum]TNX84363.1 hypothetical protein FIT55_07565 [Corynebacterium silvaticum]
MRVVFKDDDPRRLAEDASYAPRRWGVDIIKAYRKKIQVLLAATDERDLYARCVPSGWSDSKATVLEPHPFV